MIVVVLFPDESPSSTDHSAGIPAVSGGRRDRDELVRIHDQQHESGGLAIAIGELVDDAIIDVENVVRRLRENAPEPEAERLPALEVVYRASSEIRGSVSLRRSSSSWFSCRCSLLGSVEGRLLQPLGFAYVVALTASLVVALTVTPALCSLLLPKARSILRGHEPWLVRRLKAAVPAPCSAGHLTIVGFVLHLLGAAPVGRRVGSFFFMGRAFLPEFNEGTLTVSAVTLPGTSLAESDQLGRGLERILLSVPEVVSTARRTGRAELDEHVQGVESAETRCDPADADRSKEAVLEDIRQQADTSSGHECDDRPADLPPHRPHALGHAR